MIFAKRLLQELKVVCGFSMRNKL